MLEYFEIAKSDFDDIPITILTFSRYLPIFNEACLCIAPCWSNMWRDNYISKILPTCSCHSCMPWTHTCSLQLFLKFLRMRDFNINCNTKQRNILVCTFDYQTYVFLLSQVTFCIWQVCVFAYGQTGSGKTFTMMGRPEAPEQKGLIPRSLEQIFQTSQALKTQGWRFKMQASCSD